MSRGAVLVVPACGKGMGGGHMIRCMALVRGLRALGRDAWLFLPAAADRNCIIETMGFEKNWLVAETGLQGKLLSCIVLDRFQTPQEELARWMDIAPVIGIDEGGPSRDCFDFLIDILPGLSKSRANISDPSLLPLPEKKEQPAPQHENPPLKILVSFGQEDAAGLGPQAAHAIAAKNSDSIKITLLRGGSEAIHNLNEHLNDYDLVITHYGLTAFESLYAGVPVLLVSPTKYHKKLAQAAGFRSPGTGKGGAAKIAGLLLKNGEPNLPFLENLKKRCAALAAKYNLDHPPRQSLAELIDSFAPDASRSCPACGSKKVTVTLARFPERTYRRCPGCGAISMNRLTPPPIAYGREYFFEQYHKQYGTTYIEDFPNLIAMGKRRLSVIKSLLPAEGGAEPLLLDIGCAYGAFLAAAKEEGFSPYGIDPAEDAVRHITDTLGLTAAQGFFPPLPEAALPASRYDVITLWYVIEHFRGCLPALAEIRKLLKPGGVLAFATPSFSGISGRVSLRNFLQRSPADHWTIWSPAACKKALKAAGFTVHKIVITGHHPERFPLLGKYAQSSKSPLYRLLLALSTIFALGDTFEVYAVSD